MKISDNNFTEPNGGVWGRGPRRRRRERGELGGSRPPTSIKIPELRNYRANYNRLFLLGETKTHDGRFSMDDGIRVCTVFSYFLTLWQFLSNSPLLPSLAFAGKAQP